MVSGLYLMLVEKIYADVFRTNITFTALDNLAGMLPNQNTRIQKIANDFLGICGVERTNHSELHAHGQLRPGSLNRVPSEKDHLQVRKMIDDSLDDLIAQSRVGW